MEIVLFGNNAIDNLIIQFLFIMLSIMPVHTENKNYTAIKIILIIGIIGSVKSVAHLSRSSEKK